LRLSEMRDEFLHRLHDICLRDFIHGGLLERRDQGPQTLTLGGPPPPSLLILAFNSSTKSQAGITCLRLLARHVGQVVTKSQLLFGVAEKLIVFAHCGLLIAMAGREKFGESAQVGSY
jgi:hypothetical protein